MHEKTHTTVRTVGIAFGVMVMLVCSLMVISAAATAQPVNPSPTANETAATGGENPLQISPNLLLHSKSFNADSGTVTVTIENTEDTLVSATITDAGAMQQLATSGTGSYVGREIPRVTEVLKPGKNTLELPATQTAGGAVVLTVGTKTGLYGLPIEVGGGSLDFLRVLTSPQALLVGAVEGLIWVVVAGVYVLYVEGGEPRKA